MLVIQGHQPVLAHEPLYARCSGAHRCRWELRATRSWQPPATLHTFHQLMESLGSHVLDALPAKGRYLVSLAGVPGSGKTLCAHRVAQQVDVQARRRGHKPCAIAVPMDGFHLYRRELDALPDPAEAHARRGAHWTFNAPRFIECVQQLRTQDTLALPSFDHAVGDPVEEDLHVRPHHRFVIIEGLYTLLEQEPWCQVRDLVDEAWFLDCDLQEALRRVVARQVANGAAQDAAEKRVYSNDLPNGELVQSTRSRASAVLPRLPLQ